MKSPKTVLVVEDSPVQATALLQFLKQMGLHVVHAFDGRAGIEMADQVKPDLVHGLDSCSALLPNLHSCLP